MQTSSAADLLLTDTLKAVRIGLDIRVLEHLIPIEKLTALEMIEFMMDQRGLDAADMVEYFGHRSKVTEVLNGT